MKYKNKIRRKRENHDMKCLRFQLCTASLDLKLFNKDQTRQSKMNRHNVKKQNKNNMQTLESDACPYFKS